LMPNKQGEAGGLARKSLFGELVPVRATYS
jgi:hypothetical protein